MEETDKKAGETKKEGEESKEVPAPKEKKSLFAKLCGCMGGSTSAADTDTKDAPGEKKEADTEKKAEETTEDKPAGDKPATE